MQGGPRTNSLSQTKAAETETLIDIGSMEDLDADSPEPESPSSYFEDLGSLGPTPWPLPSLKPPPVPEQEEKKPREREVSTDLFDDPPTNPWLTLKYGGYWKTIPATATEEVTDQERPSPRTLHTATPTPSPRSSEEQTNLLPTHPAIGQWKTSPRAEEGANQERLSSRTYRIATPTPLPEPVVDQEDPSPPPKIFLGEANPSTTQLRTESPPPSWRGMLERLRRSPSPIYQNPRPPRGAKSSGATTVRRELRARGSTPPRGPFRPTPLPKASTSEKTTRATVKEVTDQDDLSLRTPCTVTPEQPQEPVVDREDPPPPINPNPNKERDQEMLRQRTISDLKEEPSWPTPLPKTLAREKEAPCATVEEVPDQDDLPPRIPHTVVLQQSPEPAEDLEDPPPPPLSLDPSDDEEEDLEKLLERTFSEEDEKLSSFMGSDLFTVYSHIESPPKDEETSRHHGNTPSTPVTTATEPAQVKDKEKTLEERIPPNLFDLPSAEPLGITETTAAEQRVSRWPDRAAFISRDKESGTPYQQTKPHTEPPPPGTDRSVPSDVMVDHDCTKGANFTVGLKTTDKPGTARATFDLIEGPSETVRNRDEAVADTEQAREVMGQLVFESKTHDSQKIPPALHDDSPSSHTETEELEKNDTRLSPVEIKGTRNDRPSQPDALIVPPFVPYCSPGLPHPVPRWPTIPYIIPRTIDTILGYAPSKAAHPSRSHLLLVPSLQILCSYRRTRGSARPIPQTVGRRPTILRSPSARNRPVQQSSRTTNPRVRAHRERRVLPTPVTRNLPDAHLSLPGRVRILSPDPRRIRQRFHPHRKKQCTNRHRREPTRGGS